LYLCEVCDNDLSFYGLIYFLFLLSDSASGIAIFRRDTTVYFCPIGEVSAAALARISLGSAKVGTISQDYKSSVSHTAPTEAVEIQECTYSSVRHSSRSFEIKGRYRRYLRLLSAAPYKSTGSTGN
jgi:hypothetical protein